MDVLPGPTFIIDHDSLPSYGSQNQKDGHVRRVMERPQFYAGDDSSQSSSSIGAPDDRGDEEDGEEVQSNSKRGIALDALDSLEVSLPIKNGLSSHFEGKSKSFSDLSQVSSVKELQKQENPFNKRRRVLMASRRSLRSAFYTGSNPKSMPLLPLHEDEQEDDEEKCRKLASPSSLSSSSSSSFTEEKKQEDQMLLRRRQKTVSESTWLRSGSLKSRSISLADLKEHDDDDDDEDA
ncbi:KID-containing protein 1-like [Prosopis cineraria]|uniref:KID-containing protein 1-like n=1 Tax=Prosopis cineraria TaxID=364024 RepID=UPI00240F0451|nr:KID-containing protein 1-like [Prosopis cineraria]